MNSSQFYVNYKNLSIAESIDLLKDQIDEVMREERMIRNILIITFYGLLVLVSFFGNLLVMFVCFTNQSKTNTLILSLSMSDLLMTVFNIPFNVFRIVRQDWPFGKFLCITVPFVQVMVVYVSSYTMAVIAFYRWRSITTITTSSSTSMRQIIITIIIIWSVSALFAIPTVLYNDVVEVLNKNKFLRCQVVYPESEYNIRFILSLQIFFTQKGQVLLLKHCNKINWLLILA